MAVLLLTQKVEEHATLLLVAAAPRMGRHSFYEIPPRVEALELLLLLPCSLSSLSG